MVKYCKCGCGTLIADDKTWVKGHNRNGVVVSDVTKKKMTEAIKKYFDDPLARKKASEAAKKRYEDQLEREKTSEAMKKHFEEISVSNITRKKQSEATKKYYKDPENRILHSCRMLGITRDDWDGFGSVYCELWCEELREYIRDKYGRICFICGKSEMENGRKHDVHHVDYNKQCGCDETECKLVPLCIKCHAHTTFGGREMWEELIIKMLEDVN